MIINALLRPPKGMCWGCVRALVWGSAGGGGGQTCFGAAGGGGGAETPGVVHWNIVWGGTAVGGGAGGGSKSAHHPQAPGVPCLPGSHRKTLMDRIEFFSQRHILGSKPGL